jgi:hypothetical protein
MYALSILDLKSQNAYTRSTQRYLDFCEIELLPKDDVNSVEKFLIFCKQPELKADLDIYKLNKTLPKEKLSAKTIWSVLSHLKKFFNACNNRRICEENARLDAIIQQWEKYEEVHQAKVK